MRFWARARGGPSPKFLSFMCKKKIAPSSPPPPPPHLRCLYLLIHNILNLNAACVYSKLVGLSDDFRLSMKAVQTVFNGWTFTIAAMIVFVGLFYKSAMVLFCQWVNILGKPDRLNNEVVRPKSFYEPNNGICFSKCTKIYFFILHYWKYRTEM